MGVAGPRFASGRPLQSAAVAASPLDPVLQPESEYAGPARGTY